MAIVNRFLDPLSDWIAARLETTSSGYEPFTPSDPETLSRILQPGDILLVEGNQKVSSAIKYLTQSTWSHAAIYVGEALYNGNGYKNEEPVTTAIDPKFKEGQLCLIEVELGLGCIAVPLAKYETYNTRICRPVNLTPEDRATVINFMVGNLGIKYDTRNILDLARYLFPTPPIPVRWRRRMLHLGSGEPTRAICSTLIAQAFQKVQYPILPRIERVKGEKRSTSAYSRREILHIRHHSLFAPRDFDISPYFAVVKPTIEYGFDYKRVNWAPSQLSKEETQTDPSNEAGKATSCVTFGWKLSCFLENNSINRQKTPASRIKLLALAKKGDISRGMTEKKSPTPLKNIRNFSIVAHIDHGKSTLADRLIQVCGGLSEREMQEQVLDNMEIEKERGITIKAQTVRLDYKANDGETYQLNLIDTPGHVDFAYEVSRSLSAVEGSLLVVDASQGVEAQTLANVYKAIENDHEIVPVLNKIDLPAAEPERVKTQIEDVIGLDASEAVEISAKSGLGTEDVLEAIVEKLPSPEGELDAPLKAMLVDSWYDAYLGVVVLVRVIDGTLKKGQKIKLIATDASYLVDRVGVFRPKQDLTDELGPGEMGFFTAAIKQVADTRVGDTVTDEKKPCTEALPGYQPAQPVVFCGLFPVDSSEFENLRDAMGKLRLNDASFEFEMETSAALGFGFRCGFLGLLHLEIIRERLEREFNIDLITTAPSVIYHIHQTDGELIKMHNPADMPDVMKIDHIEEPWITATILVPDEYLGAVLKLCEDRRGRQTELTYAGTRAMVVYELPMSEVVFDFYDRLKSVSKGYASFDYQVLGYEEGNLVKMSVLVNAEPVDALSMMVHRDRAEARGRGMCEKLKELIPRHLFKVPIQAAIGGKVIARETIAAMRKDVTAKCYGGDISRKRKLLDKQKAGKKKMRQFGKVEIPQDAFIQALKMDDN